MQTRIIIAAVLLALGFAVMALTQPEIPSVPPSIEPAAQAAQPQSPRDRIAPVANDRGQLLYENHCLSCHESLVHIRGQQSVSSLMDLQAKVRQWAEFLRLPWGKGEVEEVTRYLDSHFYRFESRP